MMEIFYIKPSHGTNGTTQRISEFFSHVGDGMTEHRRTRRVTLAQVAAEAGISIATVSRALSGCGNVSDSTRREIDAVAQRLGYLPRNAAAAVNGTSAPIYGIIVPSLSNPTFSTLVEAFQSASYAQGATVLVGCSHYDPGTEDVIIRRFMHVPVSGIVLVGNERDPEIVEHMLSKGITPVTTISVGAGDGVPSVGYDNTAASRELTDYLLDIGHRVIGVISGRMHNNDRSQQRVDGIRQALQARGLDFPMELLVEQSYRIGEGSAAARQLMSGHTRPTAIVCGNDLLAFGALSECQRLGFDVPGDVSIAGFDDMEFAEATSPRLTSVSVPIESTGEHAAEILRSKLQGRNTSNAIVLPTKIVVRGSTRSIYTHP